MVPVSALAETIKKHMDLIETIFEDTASFNALKNNPAFIQLVDDTFVYELSSSCILVIFTNREYIDTFSVLNIPLQKFKSYVDSDEDESRLMLSACEFSVMISENENHKSYHMDGIDTIYDPSVKYKNNSIWDFYKDGIVFDPDAQCVTMSDTIPLFGVAEANVIISPDIEFDEYFQLSLIYTIPDWYSFQNIISLIQYQESFKNAIVSFHYDGMVCDTDCDMFNKSMNVIGDLLNVLVDY